MRPPKMTAPGIPVILAGLVLLLSAAVYGLRWGLETKAARQSYVGPQLAKVPETVIDPVPGPVPGRWPAPAAQSRGTLWSFGLFTPPEIHFDRTESSFLIIPPEVVPDATTSTPVAESAGLGLKLHAVQREPYPLQLVGYIGDESDLLGTFANAVTGETLVLRAGARIAAPALSVERLELVRESEQRPESMSIRENKLRAELRENRTGRRVNLQQGVVAYTGRLQAVISTATDLSARAWHEGETITAGENRFRIEKIRLAPPAVDVTKVVSGEPDPSRPTAPTVFTLFAPR